MKVRPRNGFVLVVASAAIVAHSVETTAATEAMSRERRETSWTWSFCQAALYQRQENPSQMAIDVPALKE